MELPAIGSEWKDRGLRVKRTLRAVRYDPEKRRVRIHCIETDILTWAKPERFNGKSGGYANVKAQLDKRICLSAGLASKTGRMPTRRARR
jgi:hypothetical protein